MKKLFIISLFTFILLSQVFALQLYYDEYNNYLGAGFSEYVGKENEINVDSTLSYLRNYGRSIGTILGHVEKLTKAQTILLWKVLDAYDYKAGEYYFVSLATSHDIHTSLLLVKIEKKGELSWWSVGIMKNPFL